jgi:hypothetical protein
MDSMDADKGKGQEDYGDAGQGAGDPKGPSGPTDDERRVLSLWKEGLVSQDPRYENKGLLLLAALAMTNPEFRSRLINDSESVLNELASNYSLPSGVKLKFYENTPETLNVVLPALGGGLAKRPPEFRELLRSRTSEASDSLFADDIDLGDWSLDSDRGDPDIRDSMNSGVVAVVVE